MTKQTFLFILCNKRFSHCIDIEQKHMSEVGTANGESPFSALQSRPQFHEKGSFCTAKATVMKMNTSIYKDIAERTEGDIYIGVVGPVRTGKSTFIKRFMETLILPSITDRFDRERTRDEMPQSAAGKTVMTAEPKFIPEKAVEVTLADSAKMRVRMIDCVGYIVPEALGSFENGGPRMVHTPWQSEPMPFSEAAEYGTRKVISDHSTIGIVVTTDGTIGEIGRESYTEAEARVISELKALGKPFAIVMNSADPSREESIRLATQIENETGVPVALVSCLELSTEDIKHILEMILLEFPIREVQVETPAWIAALDSEHQLVRGINSSVLEVAETACKIGDIPRAFSSLTQNENISGVFISETDLGKGQARISVKMPDELYYKTLGELTGFNISGEEELVSLLRELSSVKTEYDKISSALKEVNETGYGIVTPNIHELTLEEPEIIHQVGGYGVKLKASGPSIHMIRADIETEISPIVGSEQQSENLVKSLLCEFDEDPKKLWESNIFGKTLHELVSEGLEAKLEHISPESRKKLSETLQRVINEGSGGLICIIL